MLLEALVGVESRLNIPPRPPGTGEAGIDVTGISSDKSFRVSGRMLLSDGTKG